MGIEDPPVDVGTGLAVKIEVRDRRGTRQALQRNHPILIGRDRNVCGMLRWYFGDLPGIDLYHAAAHHRIGRKRHELRVASVPALHAVGRFAGEDLHRSRKRIRHSFQSFAGEGKAPRPGMGQPTGEGVDLTRGTGNPNLDDPARLPPVRQRE